MNCFSCGAETQLGSGDRVGFRATCAACNADLHVCRNCAHHDPVAYNECREPGAERVGDRERANRCEWFRPHEGSGAGASQQPDPRDALDALFKKR